jgi:asparagine synthase (glutamine-hydrolysing)
MKLGLLFSGGKDSTYAGFLSLKQGHKISCLISMLSENKDSYMFHTPSISKTQKQAKAMNIPLIIGKTKGEMEKELKDLEKAIKKAKKQYKIEGIVTGALNSAYQASRIQRICDKLKLECFNPLWQINEVEYMNDLIKNKFKVITVGVFAYPLDDDWLGRKIDEKFLEEIIKLNAKYKINPAGEGGEFETFVLNCPLFTKELKVRKFHDFKEGENSFRREIEV